MLLSQKTQEIMSHNQNNNQNNNQSVRMDAEVAFYVNGNMVIAPSPWEGEKRVPCRQMKGRMTVESDGVSHFKAYRENTGRMYDTLMETANGALMRTRSVRMPKLVVKLSVPLGIGEVRLAEALTQQVAEMLAYIKTH